MVVRDLSVSVFELKGGKRRKTKNGVGVTLHAVKQSTIRAYILML